MSHNCDIGPDDPVDPDPEKRGQGNGEWLEDLLTQNLRRWGFGTYTRVKDTVEEIDVVAYHRRSYPTVFSECKDHAGSETKIGRSVIDRLVAICQYHDAQPLICYSGELNQDAVDVVSKYGVISLHYTDLERFDMLPYEGIRPRGRYQSPNLSYGFEYSDVRDLPLRRSRLEKDPDDPFSWILMGTNPDKDYFVD